MNWVQIFVNIPPLLSILLKITIILSVGWVIHFSLYLCNPHWRMILWRGIIIGIVLIPILQPLTFFPVSIAPPPESVAAPYIRVASRPHIFDLSGSSAMVSTPIIEPVMERIPYPSISLSTWVREHLSEIILFGWGFVTLSLTARFLAVFIRMRKMLRFSLPASEHLQGLLDQVANNLNFLHKIVLRYSSDISIPFLTGFRNSVIVLPERMINSKNTNKLPVIFAHEVAHLRSRDLFWMLTTRWISILLWFHPFIWRLRNAHNATCEEVCDATGADYAGNVESYSSTLARLALEMPRNVPAIGGVLMVGSSEISRRLRMLKRKIYFPLAQHRVVFLGVVGLSCFSRLLWS